MRFFTSLVYCLMALAGCYEKTGTTSITRASVDGVNVIFSKTFAADGVATFHCLVSGSGQCHYLVYAERCSDSAAATPCTRQTLDRFTLMAGQIRELRGLPQQFRECVSAQARDGGCG